MLGEPAPPGADRVEMQPRLAGDARIGPSTRRMQHHLRAHPQPVLGFVAVGHLLQPFAIGSTQDYRTGTGNRQGRQADQEKWINRS